MSKSTPMYDFRGRKGFSVHLRFWAKVGKSAKDECWPWFGNTRRGKSGVGYGQFFPSRGQPVYAHRYAYILLRGPIPDALVIDHLCDSKNCVNPWHMECVTGEENTRRARQDFCGKGHFFSVANTILTKNGSRKCRLCDNASQRRRWVARELAGFSSPTARHK